MSAKRALARRTRCRRFIRTAPHSSQELRSSSSASSLFGPAAVPSAALFTINEPIESFEGSVNMSTNSAFPVPSIATDFHNGSFAGPVDPNPTSAASRHAAAALGPTAPAMKALGTENPPFVKTLEDPMGSALDRIPNYYVSICAMPAYASKSPEELRFEDYCTKRKNPGTATSFALFGQSSVELVSSTTPTSLFGAAWQPSVLPVMPSLPNGFHFGPSPAPSGDFVFGELFQNHAPTFGTGFPRFCMFEGIDRYGVEYRTVTYYSICAIPAYRNKSPEQLRYEDYLRMQNCLPDAA